MAANSEHYTVLARRFRPQTFADVVGQQHVAQALQNAIRVNRVAHAYLFTGARGVGKTSMARILAKALNCPNVDEAIPCHECEICLGIANGTDLDVMEIDGASNRGIDDIRTLRANVNVKSMRTQYKMYIIDEVHALSKDAFNALLKTLEEPPPNVKFVFCTTEPNKVPDTILSRCQRFDFTTIATANIVGRLGQIAAAEQFEVEPAALELIARRAAGSMRDSQSLFDQLLAFGGEHIVVDDVHRLFGTAGDERLLGLVEALIERRRDALLQQVDGALAEGVQLSELIDQLIYYVRDLMLLATGAGSVPLMGVAEELRPQLEQQAAAWGLTTIVAALEILSQTKSRMFRASYARALAELGLIRISMLDELNDLSAAIEEMRSERGHGGGAAAAQRGPANVGTPQAPQRGRARPPVEKKTPNETDLTSVEPQPCGKSAPRMEFEPGCESKLWPEVVSRVNDALRTHVQAAAGIAISGPNRLEITFHKSYSFSKQFCERPEAADRLSAIVEELTGRSPQVTCRIIDDPADTKPKPTAADKADTTSKPAEIDDPFVKQVLAVFDATLVKVDGISKST